MAIPKFPFSFEKHFVPDAETPDCLGACFAMCALYWRELKPSLTFPTDLAYWKRYLEKLNVYTPNGVDTIRLLRALQALEAEKIGKADSAIQDNSTDAADIVEVEEPPQLTIRPCNFTKIDDALPFFIHNPPIPLILFFDESLSQTNQEGGGHAVLLHSFDTKVKDNVYFIDPFRHNFRTEFPMNLRVFSNGWKEWDNLALTVFPRGEGISLNSAGKRKYPTTLLEYMEFKS